MPESLVPVGEIQGAFRLHSRFQSRFLPTDRPILVYLPPGYAEDETRRYPVMYLHDGQNLFEHPAADGMPVRWCCDRPISTLVAAGAIEPVIVVGIWNAGALRIEEYTPTPDRKVGVGGHGHLYARMLIEELKPVVDAAYRTRADAAHTGVGGSSLGGLLSLYLGLHYPHVFGRIAALSPSVWWDDRMIIREVLELERKLPLRIWLSTGTAEGRRVAPNARRLRDAFLEHGWRTGVDLRYHEARGGEHNERAWADMVDPMFRFLFPPDGAALGAAARAP
ncbi:MAG: alpha/beta hydrolase-fold protein [Gemmatimonadaceae bacterium]